MIVRLLFENGRSKRGFLDLVKLIDKASLVSRRGRIEVRNFWKSWIKFLDCKMLIERSFFGIGSVYDMETEDVKRKSKLNVRLFFENGQDGRVRQDFLHLTKLIDEASLVG